MAFGSKNSKFHLGVKKCHFSKFLEWVEMAVPRGTSILGEVRNVEISRVTQQLLGSKSHDLLADFALSHSKINKIA